LLKPTLQLPQASTLPEAWPAMTRPDLRPARHPVAAVVVVAVAVVVAVVVVAAVIRASVARLLISTSWK